MHFMYIMYNMYIGLFLEMGYYLFISKCCLSAFSH